MKKFLLFLTLFLSAVGLAQAAEVTLPASGKTWASYTWTPSDKNKNYTCDNLEGYTFNLEGSSSNGKQPDASSLIIYAGGKLTITAPTDTKFTKIQVTIASSGKATGATTSETSIWSLSGEVSSGANSTFSFQAETGQSSITFWGTDGNSTTKQMRVKSVTITTEDGGTSGGNPNITWTLDKELDDNADVPAYIGEDNTLPTLSFADGANVSCTSSNESVATVDDNGNVTILAAGTTTITATCTADEKFKASTKSYALTVTKRFVWSDMKAVLVKNLNALQAGDVIIIANQDAQMAMSIEDNKNNRRTASVVFTEDLSEIKSISNNVLLLELGQSDGCWSFTTLNYLGTAGYLASQSSDNNYLYVTATENDYRWAKIDITDDGVATILFNKGAGSSKNNHNILRYNSSSKLFACYESGQQPVYIYKVVTPKTIEAQIDEPEFVESSVKLTNLVQLSKEATATKYAVLINGTQVGVFAKDSYGYVTVELTNAPYLPEAKYTICPVLAEGNPTTLGHPEELTFTFPTLPTFEVNAKTPKWYYQESKFYTEDGETYANLDLWIYMTPSVTTSLGYTFAEFDNSEAGKEIWGWYDESKEQLQNCKYNFLTKVPVTGSIPVVSEELLKGKVATATFTPVFLFNVDSKYSSLISGSTRAAAPALLGEETPILVQEVNGTKISESIEIKALTGAEVSGVESVVVEGVDGAVEYYNMQGVRVEGELAPGMYIRRQGRSVSKVQIR